MDKRTPFRLSSAILTGLLLLCATWIALECAAAGQGAPSRATADPGDVVINEVAWMGTAASFTDEWIELYNTTVEPITLTNWTLATDDGTPSVALEGVIPPMGYFLLERSDDSTVSDIPADQIYSGALENDPDAETLRLYDAGNTEIDAVNADGGSWPAGDNATKHTMERIDPLSAGADDNWADNDGVARNGLDALGAPISGTPKARNSTYAGPLPNEANLVVSKSGPAEALVGDAITYTIRLSNTGSVTATGVRLTDSLPSAVTFISQTSAITFSEHGRLLVWTTNQLTEDAAPVLITVTGRISTGASALIRNTVTATTATTETITANNYAVWVTQVNEGPGEARVVIAALLYDGYQLDDRDEAVQLINAGDAPADLLGWQICDAAGGGSCATIPDVTLGAGDGLWLAYWATDFYTSSGFYPTCAARGLVSGTLGLSGSWPRYANTGEAVVLRDEADRVVDTLVYEDGDTGTWGWSGSPVEPWSGREGFRVEGQILYRRLDEATGLPVPDTDTAADWAQYAGDPILGRRVRYPGWDIDSFFFPLTAHEEAHLTLGVAPDNAAEVVLNAIDSAQRQIDIGVYALTHPTVINRLVGKASAGVTVTVLLEGDQAGVSKTDARWYQQMWACQALHATAHGACWFMVNDDEARIFDRYRFMHAKYMLLDRERVLITSQNLTPQGMPDDDRSNGTYGSRGVALLTDAPAVVARAAEVFERDLDPAHHRDLVPWSPTGSDYGPPPPGFTPAFSVTDYTTYTVLFSAPLTLHGAFTFELFTAPEAALRQSDALLGLLARAGMGDGVYVEVMDERAQWGDDPIHDPSPRTEAYIAAARRGARVRILLNGGQFDADYVDHSHNIATAAYVNLVANEERLDLKAAVADPTASGIHNKMVLVWIEREGGYVHLGSLNGSETSSKVNRELAIQIRSDEAYVYLKAVFDWDWFTSHPWYLPLMLGTWSPPAPPVGYPLISEVLYNPSGAGEGDEWVEIYNPTDGSVDLSGWYLGDVGPAGEYGSGLYIFPGGALLPSEGVIVVVRQATDVVGFRPDFEFRIDPLNDDPDVPNMLPAGAWDGFGFALGNSGDEVLLLDGTTIPVDVVVYGNGSYPNVIPHPGVSAPSHSLERRPAIYDTDDCSHDFFERVLPDPGNVSRR